MWSCVVLDKFGFGRIVASSAPVEGKFNKLKNVFFKGELPKIIADHFLEKRINLLNGSTKLIQTKLSEFELKNRATNEENGIELGTEKCRYRKNVAWFRK